jgi:hypothetical protein
MKLWRNPIIALSLIKVSFSTFLLCSLNVTTSSSTFLICFLCQLDDGLVGSYSKLHWGKRAYHQRRRPCKLAGWYLACWCCCTGGKRLSVCHCVHVFLCLSLTMWRYTYVEVTCAKNVQIKWSLVYWKGIESPSECLCLSYCMRIYVDLTHAKPCPKQVIFG